MKKLHNICIYALLALGTVSCADNLDSDKYFKDRTTLEDVFTDKTRTEQWLANAYSYLNGENMEVSTRDNILWCFADDIYSGAGADYKNSEQVRMMKIGVIHGDKVIRVSGKPLFSCKISI